MFRTPRTAFFVWELRAGIDKGLGKAESPKNGVGVKRWSGRLAFV